MMKRCFQSLCLISTILLMGKIAIAGTLVAGNVSGTWDMAGSPYFLTDNCTVPSGLSLTIEPGVEVIIGDSLSLTVDGWIEAIGLPGAPISITSPNETIYWGTIIVKYSGSGLSKFHYCNFKNASTAIYLINNAYTNTEMKNEIKNCNFDNCVNDAIFAEAHGTFKSNGMSAPTAYGPFISPVIDSCSFNNTNNGIVIFVHGSRWRHTMGYWYTYGGSSPKITNNVFNNIIEACLYLDKGLYVTNNSFPVYTNNTITNSENGVFTQPPYDVVIKNNIFYKISIGVQRTESSLSSNVFFNNFFSNETNFVGYPSSYGQIVMTNANGDPCDIGFNIFMDPAFVTPTDLHLAIDSPCIDAGDDITLDLPTYDLENKPRRIDGNGDFTAVVDMGAYENGDICECDYLMDLDTDGEDLADYINDHRNHEISILAEDFGRVNCPNYQYTP